MLEIDKKLEEYILNHTEAESDALYNLNRQTHLNMIHPRMLSGHLQGRVLAMFSNMIKPKYILEIGTFTGYSAICLSEGLQANGKVFTFEIDDEIADYTNLFLKANNFNNKIEVIQGDALQLINTLEYKFDLAFIDGDKKEYLNYYNAIFNKVSKGGYIIADNVLWSGKVIENIEENDEDTKAILDFNKSIQEDNRVENVLFPIRDGLMVMRKK